MGKIIEKNNSKVLIEIMDNKNSFQKITIEKENKFIFLWILEGEIKIKNEDFYLHLKKNQGVLCDHNTSFEITSSRPYKLGCIKFNESIFHIDHDNYYLLYQNEFISNLHKEKFHLFKGKYISKVINYLNYISDIKGVNSSFLYNLTIQTTIKQMIFSSTFNKLNNMNKLKIFSQYEKKILEKFNKYVLKYCKVERNVKFYCERIGVDYNLLNKICLTAYAVNVKNHIDSSCVKEIKKVLSSTSLSITEISDLFNYSDTSNFLRFFKRMTNMTITEYKEKNFNDYTKNNDSKQNVFNT